MSDAVVVWTVVSVLGMFVSGWGTFDAVRSLNALGGDTNGRRTIAWGYIRAEGLRFLIQTAWTAIGIALLIDHHVVHWSPPTIMLVVTNVALLYKSADGIYVRLKVRHTPLHSLGRAETAIERQDREVGEERRQLQAHDAEDKA